MTPIYPMKPNYKVGDKIDINNLPIHESKYDSQKLYNYLVVECNMNQKRIQNSMKNL